MSVRSAAIAVLTLVAMIGVICLLLVSGGYPVGLSLSSLWSGSVGSWYSFTSATLVRAVPLMLAGGAVAIAFRAGVLNIGAEGQLLAGATASASVALALPSLGPVTLVLALVAAAVGGAAWAGIAAALRRHFGVLEVISTIMLNFVALDAVGYFVRGPLQEPTRSYPQSATIAPSAYLPHVPGAGRLHAGIFIALALLALGGWMMRHSAPGFRLRAVGESPSAAASAGRIDVARVAMRAFLLSGALAGLAGGCEVLGVTYALYENISPGYGFTAIAVALLAGLDLWWVIPSALLFAALESGAGAMQRDAGVPSTIVTIIDALLILAAVAWQARRVAAARVALVMA
ncbi:MAG: ABC transporter permease [Gemmatimonadaceae bacterium]|nr:ABC transporter permease [Gemmatimonadaceae bacterium]